MDRSSAELVRYVHEHGIRAIEIFTTWIYFFVPVLIQDRTAIDRKLDST